MLAGTRMPRIRVASMRTANASPTPSCLSGVTSDSANPRNTAIMMAAALLITRPVRATP
jgi:hypothetical protein